MGLLTITFLDDILKFMWIVLVGGVSIMLYVDARDMHPDRQTTEMIQSSCFAFFFVVCTWRMAVHSVVPWYIGFPPGAIASVLQIGWRHWPSAVLFGMLSMVACIIVHGVWVKFWDCKRAIRAAKQE